MFARDCPMEEFQEPAHWDAWPAEGDEGSAWRTTLLRPAAEHVLPGISVSPVANNRPELIHPVARVPRPPRSPAQCGPRQLIAAGYVPIPAGG